MEAEKRTPSENQFLKFLKVFDAKTFNWSAFQVL